MKRQQVTHSCNLLATIDEKLNELRKNIAHAHYVTAHSSRITFSKLGCSYRYYIYNNIAIFITEPGSVLSYYCQKYYMFICFLIV